jgi:hypothetical protein
MNPPDRLLRIDPDLHCRLWLALSAEHRAHCEREDEKGHAEHKERYVHTLTAEGREQPYEREENAGRCEPRHGKSLHHVLPR